MQITFSTGSKVCLTSIRPRCIKPVVELCSAKSAVGELHKGAVAWFLQLWTLQDDVTDAASAFSTLRCVN